MMTKKIAVLVGGLIRSQEIGPSGDPVIASMAANSPHDVPELAFRWADDPMSRSPDLQRPLTTCSLMKFVDPVLEPVPATIAIVSPG